jgi:hypothetical protein
MYEPTGSRDAGEVGWFAGISRAARANLPEERIGAVRLKGGRAVVKLPPFRIETLLLDVPPPGASFGAEDLGRRVEPGQPIYFAHWEHNAHAEPLGGSPVGISLRGEVITDTHVRQGGYTVNTVHLGLVNNLTTPIRGKVRFGLPEGWRTVPAEVAYDIAPRSSATFPVALAFDSGPRRGAVRALLDHDAQTYEAVLEIGAPAALAWDLKPTRTGALVVVRSDYPEAVAVDAYAIAPHELWGDLAEGAALADMPDRYRRLVVPAGGEARWAIAAPHTADAWLTARLAWHGRVDYRQIRLGGP